MKENLWLTTLQTSLDTSLQDEAATHLTDVDDQRPAGFLKRSDLFQSALCKSEIF